MESILLILDVAVMVLLAYCVFQYERRPQRKSDLGLLAFKINKSSITDAKKRRRRY